MSNLLVPDIIKEMAEFVIVTNGLRTKIEGIDENTYPLLSAYQPYISRHVIHTTFIVLYAFLIRQATPKLK